MPAAKTDFETLWKENERLFFTATVKIIQSSKLPFDPEDELQEARIRAWKGFHTYNHDYPFKKWVYQIIRNSIIDRVRRSQRQISGFSLDAHIHNEENENMSWYSRFASPDLDPAVILEREMLSEPMERALKALPDVFRNTLIGYELEGLSYKEIAERDDTTLGTVRSRLHRGRNQVRGALTP